MEARNPNTGNFEKLYVKALDSMPIGTEVDFDGQASDIPVGWEEVDNVLWTNLNPTSSFESQSIVLSSGDYNYLEIYFKTYIAQDNVKSVKVEKGQNAVLDCAFYYNSKNYMGTRQITYTDATHLSVGEGHAIIQDDVLNNGVTNEWIIPIKIIGYK